MDVHGPTQYLFCVLAEHGFVGLALYLLLLFTILFGLYRTGRDAVFWGEEAGVWVRVMFQFSLVAFNGCRCVLGRAYFDYYFTIVAARSS